MALKDIKAVVVGVGFIGVAHVEALRRLGVYVAGVVGSSPERAREKAAKANLPQVYDSLEDVVSDESVDVVHIASPNHVHADQVRLVLDGNKHVVCEKPLALSPEDTADLVERARTAGKVHAVCFNIRFYPLNHQAMAMVADGAIGEPRFITGSYHQDWLLKETDWNWRLQPEVGGSLRAVADIGSHWLDLTRFISGKNVESVMADLHTLVPVRRHPPGPVESFGRAAETSDLIEEEMTTDDAAGILLRYEGAVRGAVTISQVSAGEKNSVRYEIAGSEGAISWFSQHPDQLRIGRRDRPNEVLYRDPAMSAEEAARIMAYPGGHVEGFPDTFRGLFGQVYEDVSRGAPSPAPRYPTFDDGHDAVLVTEAVARSDESQQWTDVRREKEKT